MKMQELEEECQESADSAKSLEISVDVWKKEMEGKLRMEREKIYRKVLEIEREKVELEKLLARREGCMEGQMLMRNCSMRATGCTMRSSDKGVRRMAKPVGECASSLLTYSTSDWGQPHQSSSMVWSNGGQRNLAPYTQFECMAGPAVSSVVTSQESARLEPIREERTRESSELEISTTSNSSKSQQFPFKCHNCGEAGHRRSECSKPHMGFHEFPKCSGDNEKARLLAECLSVVMRSTGPYWTSQNGVSNASVIQQQYQGFPGVGSHHFGVKA